MNNVVLYHETNSLQKRDAVQILEEYSKKIRRQKLATNLIDIGCGDGSITATVLKNYFQNIPLNIIGCDINEKMVQHASKFYKDEQVGFVVQNIEGDLSEGLKENFDFAFSSYTFHWVRNQRFAFTNIYKLLKDEGQCLLIILAQHPAFDAYRTLSRRDKWSSWMKGVERFISPYHDKQELEKIKGILETIGFTNIDVKFHQKEYMFQDVEAFKLAMKSINAFDLPSSIIDEFINDFMEIIKCHKLFDLEQSSNDSNCVKLYYSLCVIYASKHYKNGNYIA